ncbi:hypothetical protein ACIRO1_37790 [Streptomyces sp. NPDC102381]|uniref:hypothetical protein n=1 Tax=Streptomyces sp. NPDC102381 TaxID=3366164 RepID=UPI003802FEC3
MHLAVTRLVGLTAAMSALALIPVSASANPAPSPEPSASRIMACKVNANNPHWSKRGKSVIYKTRLTCAGSKPAADIRCEGQLAYSVGGGPSVAASSSQIQTVTNTGAEVTYYTPEPGGKKVDWSGSFQGNTTCYFVDGGTVGQDESAVVHVTAR